MTTCDYPKEAITAVILAGGQGRRMGGIDKGLVELAGKPLVGWILEAVRPQVGAVLINANRSAERYARFGHPLIQDDLDGYPGPLAGMASGLAACETPWALFVPCDGPRVPATLAERLHRAATQADAPIAAAHDGERLQPVYALVRRDLLADLRAQMASGERRIARWFAGHGAATVDFADVADCFVNVNTPDELERVAALM